MPQNMSLSPSSTSTCAASSTAFQTILAAAPTHKILHTVTQNQPSLFHRAKLFTRFLLASAPLPSFLRNHATPILLLTTGAALGSTLSHFFQRHKESAGKIQLAVFHILRTMDALPDLEERLQNPRGLIAAIENEVLELVEVHGQISKGEGIGVVRDLKRRVWTEVDERERRRKRQGVAEREDGQDGVENEDVEMQDYQNSSPRTNSPSQKQNTPTLGRTRTAPTPSSFGLNYVDPTLYSPSPPSTTTSTTILTPKPKSRYSKPLLERATRCAFRGPVPPITENKLTRSHGAGTPLSPLPQAVSPPQSSDHTVVRYRVAESRRLWRDLERERGGKEGEEECEDDRELEKGVEEGNGKIEGEVVGTVEEKVVVELESIVEEDEKKEENEEEKVKVVTTLSPPKKNRGCPRKDLGSEKRDTPAPKGRSSSRPSAYKGGYKV